MSGNNRNPIQKNCENEVQVPESTDKVKFRVTIEPALFIGLLESIYFKVLFLSYTVISWVGSDKIFPTKIAIKSQIQRRYALFKVLNNIQPIFVHSTLK